MRLFNRTVECHFRAKRSWADPRLFKSEYYQHFVWGKISLMFGQPHLMPITVCAHCNEEIQLLGEDYLDWCEGCQSVEGDTLEMTMEEFEALG